MASGRSRSSYRSWINCRQRLCDVPGRAKLFVKRRVGSTGIHEGQLCGGDSWAFGQGCTRGYLRQIVLGGCRFGCADPSPMSFTHYRVSVVRRQDNPLLGSIAVSIGIRQLDPVRQLWPAAGSAEAMQSWHHRGNDMGECNDLRKNHR